MLFPLIVFVFRFYFSFISFYYTFVVFACSLEFATQLISLWFCYSLIILFITNPNHFSCCFCSCSNCIYLIFYRNLFFFITFFFSKKLLWLSFFEISWKFILCSFFTFYLILVEVIFSRYSF